MTFFIFKRFADKENKVTSDAEEVSSTSKNEQPVEELKELLDEVVEASPEIDLNKPSVACDKNVPTTTTRLEDEDDDIMIIS